MKQAILEYIDKRKGGERERGEYHALAVKFERRQCKLKLFT
jgi:hypothetical protein